jgi:hypothetical protein
LSERLNPTEPPPQITLTDLYEIDARMASLSLSRDLIVDAIVEGNDQRGMRHTFDPVMLGGVNAWGRTVRKLSEAFCNDAWQWQRDDIYSQPRIYNTELSIALLVQSGNASTGSPRAHPKTKYPKGLRTEAAVRMNAAGQLFGPLEGERQPIKGPLTTWLLLIHSYRGEVRAELSLPNGMDKRHYVADFSERMILPIDGGGVPVKRKALPGEQPPPSVEVKVQRRIG